MDIHVHFREPGQTHKETIGTGSRAAAAGGFTTVVCIRTRSPPADNAGTIQFINDAIDRDAVVKVLPTGCITVGMKRAGFGPDRLPQAGGCGRDHGRRRLRPIQRTHAQSRRIRGHVRSSDHGPLPGPVDDPGCRHERGRHVDSPGAQELAERCRDLIVARNIVLAISTGRAHPSPSISRPSTRSKSYDETKTGASRITSEATPHHFALTDSELSTYDTNFKMNPPLRTEEDRQALVEGLRDGTIDCISTDHAPHTNYEKDREFDFAPNGIIGLETALAVSIDILVSKAKFKLPEVINLMTQRPAKILGLEAGTLSEGAPADICLFDPKESWRLRRMKAGFSSNREIHPGMAARSPAG